MKIVYVEPGNKYAIIKNKDMFGEVEYFCVCKWDENPKKHKLGNYNNWAILQFEDNLRDAFRFFRNMSIITPKEFIRQCELFGV
jgi:hypothetical protein